MTPVERIQQKRDALIEQMRDAVAQRKHKLQGEIGQELRALTMRQLQVELRGQRKRYRAVRFGKGAGACRTKAKKIAERIRENA